ncbi:MAG TPA: GNAT family N-acetyltransferase [Egibacteraceae bacterium]|nr:GNAT family N-acetyltransferase [Egibacteraceae bacterium]
MFPTDALAEHWSRQRGLELTGQRAWGVPLVRDGGLLRTAGRSDFPGVFPDPAQPPVAPARGATVAVLHDVADDEGMPGEAARAYPGARVHRRYECAFARFGTDPDAYCRATLSTKRRKRLRHDIRKLGAHGALTIRWVEPREADAMFDHFFRLLCSRVAYTRAYDANVRDEPYLRDLWRRFAGRELLVSALCVGDRPVSFRTGYAVGDRFVGYMPAVDRGFRESVGDVHMQLLMPELVERGIAAYYMGKGSRGNKDVWANGTYTLSTIVIALSASLRARALVEVEGVRQRARRAVTAHGWDQPLRRALYAYHTRPGRAFGRTLRGALADGPATR